MLMTKTRLKHYFDLLFTMTERELVARYKKTTLGFFWVLLSPMLHALIISFVISLFINIPNYFLFLISGLLPWSFFSNTVKKATLSIVAERRLLQKAKFPIEIIPTSIVLADFINLGLLLFLLFSFLLVTKTIVFSKLLLMIPALLWLVVLAEGISLLASSLQVKYRDIDYIVSTLLVFGFYVTPVIFTLSFIPSNFRPIFFLNPLSSIIELIHIATVNNGFLSPWLILANLLITITLFILGITVFKKLHRQFIDWL